MSREVSLTYIFAASLIQSANSLGSRPLNISRFQMDYIIVSFKLSRETIAEKTFEGCLFFTWAILITPPKLTVANFFSLERFPSEVLHDVILGSGAETICYANFVYSWPSVLHRRRKLDNIGSATGLGLFCDQKKKKKKIGIINCTSYLVIKRFWHPKLVGRSPTFAFWRKVGYQAYIWICTYLTIW